ncbi:PIN domain-containing protein [Collimonas pratensis]|uniref:type II toxin-antitoxin system VapC family toxin n=1 Tax=Collimonas pratensis TaxID=279113 RepID=UPI00143CDE22|nr:type II toxin-antitoxin system VapC family toxin [Collimonas pratensis]NKI70649.1 PIN domain-containing protein [Collimonas pratensis]
MVSALFDTNILIDYLNGIEQARAELDRFSDKAISLVTWMEVMVGATPETEAIMRSFLNGFTNLPIDEQVANIAIAIRKKYRMKLPDAIVWGTAQVHGRILVTRNTKDFAHDEPGIRIPYQIG